MVAALSLALLAAPLTGHAVARGQAPHQHESHAAQRAEPTLPQGGAPLPSASLYALPMRFTAHDGATLEVASLRGAPVVIAMVYTSCTMTCPVITGEMLAVQTMLPPAVRARTTFILATFDPARDNAPRMRAFATRMQLDGQWRVLSGSPAATRRLAVLLGVSYRQLPSGDFDHSNLITVLDADGVPRHQEVRIPPDRARLARAIVGVATPR